MAPTTASGRAVICLDGITRTAIKRLTPPIAWDDYVARLRQRRSDLKVVHLKQPYDWWEIIAGRAEEYPVLVEHMLAVVREQVAANLSEIVLLGFSMGGLTALNLAHAASQLVHNFQPQYVAYVSLGTPFGGTGYLSDTMLKQLHISYIQRIFDLESTKRYMRDLLEYARTGQLRILLGQIERDELVSPQSSWLPADWLYFVDGQPNLRWDKFIVPTGNLIRAHDGLLHDPVALAFIDGLVDGLLPSPADQGDYEPFPPFAFL
ncbi:hypothetical protein JW859_08865 [bacterium]|nr:hypothetical protein [bacterium]